MRYHREIVTAITIFLLLLISTYFHQDTKNCSRFERSDIYKNGGSDKPGGSDGKLPKSEQNVDSFEPEIRTKTHIQNEENEVSPKDLKPRLKKISPLDELKKAKKDPKWKPQISDKLQKYAPEVFGVVPKDFLRNFKNPCFYKDGTKDLYCLPYFYIVGMAKCGTTDVWDKIVSHPDVIDVPKEPHWWGLRRFRTDTVKLYQDKVEEVLKMPESPTTTHINYYLNWFKKFAVPNITATVVNAHGYHQKVFGDASVSTATGIDDRWVKLDPEAKEPPFVTADLLHAIQPNAKIIIMIRNTTVWAQSWFRYSIGGANPQNFNTTMLHFIDCVNECLKKHTEKYCAYSDSCGRETYHPLRDVHIGVYHWFIRDWFRTFGRKNVMVIPLEDWNLKKTEVYRQILDYLQLRQLTSEEELNVLGRKTKNTIKHKLEMFDDVRQGLKNFFAPHNRKLAELLHDDRYKSYI